MATAHAPPHGPRVIRIPTALAQPQGQLTDQAPPQERRTYRVKEAVYAIHEAMHRSDGVHPFDAQEMDSELLGAYSSAQSEERRSTQHARLFCFR